MGSSTTPHVNHAGQEVILDLQEKRTMNSGRNRKIASVLSTVVVLGYIGSFAPSMLSWWEQTWYPHGRETTVVKPDSEIFRRVPSESIDQEEKELLDDHGLMRKKFNDELKISSRSGD